MEDHSLTRISHRISRQVRQDVAPDCLNCHRGCEKCGLNRTHYIYKTQLPPLPKQSRNYINIANYNARTSYKDKGTSDSWENRKENYFKVIQMQDEAHQLMLEMQEQLTESLSNHLSEDLTRISHKISRQVRHDVAPDLSSMIREHCQKTKASIIEDKDGVTDCLNCQRGSEKCELSSCQFEKNCITCEFGKKELYPVFETTYFRIALKTSYDEKGIVYGNFPYPYRLIITLKRHAPQPSEKEWLELRKILEALETHVKDDLGAEYTSYGVFQDVYYKNREKSVSKTPHYFLHFIFRFPKGITLKGTQFKDPNPYDQFKFCSKNLIKEEATKTHSNFIYKRIPDIINIQELTFEQAHFLKEKLPNHKLIGYTAYSGLPLEQVKPDTWIAEILAIAYRTDRFECLDHGVSWISPTPDLPSVGYGSSRERIVVWAKLQDIRTNKIFFMFNVHYDHLGGKCEFVDSEIQTIKKIAKDDLWFSFGERFYRHFNGEKMYQHYLNSFNCSDVRDKSLMGHYGEGGSWGGFTNDPFAVQLKDGIFDCDTLDVCFTNSKDSQIILTYSFNGAFHPTTKQLYDVDELIKDDFQFASDHFMTGFYVILENNDHLIVK